MAILKKNSLNFGTIGSTVIDGSNSAGGGDAFTNINGSPVIAAGLHGRGADCSGSSSANAFIGWQGLTATLTFGVRYYLKLIAAASATGQIMTVRNASNYILGNNVTAASKMTVNHWNGGTLYTSTTTLALNTWYRVEVYCTVTTTGSGQINWRLFSGDSTTPLETFTSTTADLQSTGAVAARFGKHASSGTVGLIIDDPIITNTAAYPGPYVPDVVVAPIDGGTVNSLDTITVPIALTSGETPDSTEIDQNSGPPVSINQTTRKFRAPATVAGATIVLEVTATAGGVTSTPVLATYNVRPHRRWARKPTGWSAVRSEYVT